MIFCKYVAFCTGLNLLTPFFVTLYYNGSPNISSDFDNLSAESEVDRFERLAGEVFGDIDTDDDKDFAGFEFEMPVNIAFEVGRHPIRTLDQFSMNNQPDEGPQVNIENNAKPVDLFNIYFDDNIL